MKEWTFIAILGLVSMITPAAPIIIGRFIGPRKPNALKNATRFAAAAGALACNKFGAQPSMPHLDDILRLMRRSC